MLNTKKSGIITGSLLLVGLLSLAAPPASEAQNPLNVKVSNPVTSPALVRDVNDARQPVQVSKTMTTNSSAASAMVFAVPAGKRLVIETVTVRANLGSEESPDFSELITNTTDPNPGIALAINSVFHEILVTRQGVDLNGRAAFAGTHQVRLYSEPNTFLFFQFGRSAIGSTATVLVSISGYLVDVP